MSWRHSALLTGAPSGNGAVYADRFVRSGPDARRVAVGRTHTKVAAPTPIRLTGQRQQLLEEDIRRDERRKERARIVQELHDTVLQGFLGASLVLHEAAQQMPADSPSKPALSRALHLVRRAIDDGRAAIRGVHMASPAPSSLEQAFSSLLSEITTAGKPRPRIFVQGKPRILDPAIQKQLYLIGREAVMNALRHAEATKIEIEVQYQSRLLRLFVRDNGCGIDAAAAQTESDSHWGLRGMRERAENIGAQLRVWSRTGAGTEVCVDLPGNKL